MKTNQIDQIITDMGDANDDLLALLDDLWLEIDHTNPECVRIGSARMIAVLESLKRFRESCDDVSTNLRAFLPKTPEPEQSKAASSDEESKQEANIFAGKAQISLREDFSYRRPFGFRLRGQAYPWLRTWVAVFEKLCLVLRESNPVLFETLPDRDEMMSTHGNCYFSRDRTALRSPLRVSETVFAETNLSAKLIRDLIRKLLAVFRISESDAEFYLRR
jgi:hypothetical protein